VRGKAAGMVFFACVADKTGVPGANRRLRREVRRILIAADRATAGSHLQDHIGG